MKESEYQAILKRPGKKPCPSCAGSGIAGPHCICGTCNGEKYVTVEYVERKPFNPQTDPWWKDPDLRVSPCRSCLKIPCDCPSNS